MSGTNRYGLSRHIPSGVRREVRQRSKFGCVSCRAGVTQYEHIDPEFIDAATHDPARMCLLCGSCHDKVTRGQWSKAKVATDYQRVQHEPGITPPRDFLDLHSGAAALRIGGLFYNHGVHRILTVCGEDVISVTPGIDGEPGCISATFCDDAGGEIFRIRENVWEGATRASDIQVEGPRIEVKGSSGRLALRLRVEPPGSIVVEHVDMRFGPAWLMASESSYAVGRDDIVPGRFLWTSVRGLLNGGGTDESIAIEVSTPWVSPHNVILGPATGVAQPCFGIAIGKGCNMQVSHVASRLDTPSGIRSQLFDNKLSFFSKVSH